ncbi:MAG: ABC transporter permease [Candidatus Dormibacteraceae bacterium]
MNLFREGVFAITGRGFVGALRAELLKTGKRWAPWILLGISLLVLVGFQYLIEWLVQTYAVKHPAGVSATAAKASLYPAGFAFEALSASLAPAMATILGVLLIGIEYGSETLKTLFTIRPARLEALAAKFSAILIAVAIGVVVTFAAAAAASVVFGALDGQPLNHWPSAGQVVEAMLGTLLIWCWWAFFGAALAILLRNVGLAIGLGLAWSLIAEGLILSILAVVGGKFWQGVANAFPGGNAKALSNVFEPASAVHATVGAVGAPAATVGAGQATFVLLGYCVLALVVSFAFVGLRDVT